LELKILDELEKIYKYKNGWFACAVTRGYEMKVYNELKKLLENEYWSKYIYDIFIPMEISYDKKGKAKQIIVPAYKGTMYIKMVLTQEVYSTIKIDGFRTPLPAKDPVPVPQSQMDKVLKYRMKDVE
jgi:transcription antitermination factor NusG